MAAIEETIHELLGEQAEGFAQEAIHQINLLSKVVALQTGALELHQAVEGSSGETGVEKVEDSARSLATIIKLGLGALSQIADTTDIDVRSLLDEGMVLPSHTDVRAIEPALPVEIPVPTRIDEKQNPVIEGQPVSRTYSPEELHQDFIDRADIYNPSIDHDSSDKTDVLLKDGGVLEVKGEAIALSEKEIALFNILMLHRHEFLPRSGFIEHGFSYRSLNTNAQGQAFTRAKGDLMRRLDGHCVIESDGVAAASRYRLSDRIKIIDCRTSDGPTNVKKK